MKLDCLLSCSKLNEKNGKSINIIAIKQTNKQKWHINNRL